MNKAKFTIFALSDATGELAHNLATSAVRQFPQHNAEIVRVPRIKDINKLETYVKKTKECNGVIVFTFVSTEMRQTILKLAKENEIVAIDVMGQTLDVLANYFHDLPSPEPGLQYKLTQHYFKRTEALEFTVKHDDGLGLDTISSADLILLGISRTSKTPLSIYLAYNGFRCANIPIVKDIPPPNIIHTFDKNKMIGLTISAEKLSTLRASRLRKLGRPETEAYSKLEHISEEAIYAQKIFQKLGITVIDVTDKAIEETASDIINIMKLEV